MIILLQTEDPALELRPLFPCFHPKKGWLSGYHVVLEVSKPVSSSVSATDFLGDTTCNLSCISHPMESCGNGMDLF